MGDGGGGGRPAGFAEVEEGAALEEDGRGRREESGRCGPQEGLLGADPEWWCCCEHAHGVKIKALKS